MFAIVQIAGKQYRVAPGEHIVVDKIPGKVGDEITFNEILLVSDDKKTTIGTPYVVGKKVTATISKQGLGEKLHVSRYKQKVRYRKTIGFRAHETELDIRTVA